MKNTLKIILFILCICFTLSLSAEIRLPAIFGDNMVLQQQSNTPIWGWASPGEELALKGSWTKSEIAKTKADEQGKWMVKIKTPKAGGPYILTIRGKKTLVLHNVLIGEVWVCSGQSNMEMPVSGWSGAPILNSAAEIQAAKYPDIRLFTVEKKVAIQPQEDCTGSWSACTPETVTGFSATAYFFGKQLYQKLKVPIGLIHTSWGGTVAEAWTSERALREHGDFDAALNTLDSIRPHLNEIIKKDQQNIENWNKEKDQINEKYASGFPDSEQFADWKIMNLPTKWESAGLPGLDGIVWFRKIVNIPASWAEKPLKLDLGPIDDMDITWFNGQEVGRMQGESLWAKNRSYPVPGKLVKAGKNVIAVRVTDIRSQGGIYGKKELLKLYPSDQPENGISIAGDWHYKVAAIKHESLMDNNPNTPSVLYNGMITPLIPYGIRGTIWYQGESNVGRAAQYATLFPAMITDWRNRWQEGDFPFYFVQIAPYPYGGTGIQSAALRDAQRRSLSLPHTGMAVTLDIGDTTNIHPANKEEVGKRLALWTLAKTYNKEIAYSGPLYKSMQVQGDKVILTFDHADGELITKGGELDHFQIAGSDGQFVSAKASINGNKIMVYSPQITQPTAVRYAWRDNAIPHLYNKAGLPASTFTTEKSLDHHYDISEKEVTHLIEVLASDAMEGRQTFTPGIEKAANFIADQFKKAGLEYLPGADNFRQEFHMIRAIPEQVSLRVAKKKMNLENMILLTTQKHIHWTGKSNLSIKTIKAGDDFLNAFRKYMHPQSNTLVWVDKKFSSGFSRIKKYFSDQTSFPDSISAIFLLSDSTPDDFDLEISNQLILKNAANIVGLLPGKTKPDEYVIFSAHYDHLGIGAPVNGDSIYNGANDDASGTTAVIELAKYFKAKNENNRTLIFATFTGEEEGGYGSQYFSRQLEPDKVVAMFNIEMIGTESKWGKNSAYITGYDKTDFGKILQKNLVGSPFHFHPDPYPKQNLFYRSDNATLAHLGVPAHTISTSKMDNEPNYHKVTDEISTLDPKNMTWIIRAIAISSKGIISGEDTPTRVAGD